MEARPIPVKECIEALEDHRIYYDPDFKFEQKHIVWWGKKRKPIAGEGGIIMITGTPKSRKGLLVDCLMSAQFRGPGEMSLGFHMELPKGDIIHFDTEQSRSEIQQYRNRFHRWCGFEKTIPNWKCYHLKTFWYLDRMDQIAHVLEHTDHVACVIIDQIGDMVKSENDDDSCRLFYQMIAKYSEMHQCLFILTLHTNRSREALASNGKIGSMFDKKCASQFLLTFNDDTYVTTVRHKYSRVGRPIDKFGFSQNEDETPRYEQLTK